jgi:hypothetical protein
VIVNALATGRAQILEEESRLKQAALGHRGCLMSDYCGSEAELTLKARKSGVV